MKQGDRVKVKPNITWKDLDKIGLGEDHGSYLLNNSFVITRIDDSEKVYFTIPYYKTGFFWIYAEWVKLIDQGHPNTKLFK